MTPAQLVPTATAPPNATAGPSTLRPKRKPTAPHPSTSSHNASRKRRKLPPPLPITASIMEPAAKPGGSKTLPIKTLQGVGTKRTDTPRRAGPLGREVVLVARKMGVGAYLGRCRSLICDEGYTHIVLHAIGAAIPQALVLLHALLEVLPYPRHPRGVWYEIFTGRVACTDEEQAEADAEADTAEAGKEGAKVKSWLKNIGSVEASETILKERIASSIQIHIHVGPKSEAVLQAPKAKPEPITSAAPLTVKKRNRPGKQKRQAMARLKDEAGKNGEGEMEVDEEAAMNFMPASSPEEVEMIEG